MDILENIKSIQEEIKDLEKRIREKDLILLNLLLVQDAQKELSL